MTLDLIETFKTFIYSPKHTRHTNTFFNMFVNKLKTPYFRKLEVQTHQRFMLICIALFLFYAEGHTA